MMALRLVLLLMLSLVLSSCATQKPLNDYSDFYTHPPRSILVVPVMNESVQIVAPKMLVTTTAYPLGERGYYVFPTMLTEALLLDLGLPDAGLIHQLPPMEFYNRFGADAVLFITIEQWSSKYIVLNNTIDLQARYVLVDTRTGDRLWERTQRLRHSSGGSGLIEMAINAAIDKIAAESFDAKYRPLAKQLNHRVFTTPNFGLPAGPYHPGHGKDSTNYPVAQAKPTP